MGLSQGWRYAKGDAEAVPAIDRNNSQRQIDEFRIAEVLLRLGKDIIRHAVIGKQRDTLGPGKRRSR